MNTHGQIPTNITYILIILVGVAGILYALGYFDTTPNYIDEPVIYGELTGTVDVRAVSNLTGDPVGGATVTLNNVTAVVSSSGTWRFPDLLYGNYTATAAKAGWVTGSTNVNVNSHYKLIEVVMID